MILNKIIDAGDHDGREADTVSAYFAKELFISCDIVKIKNYFFIPISCILYPISSLIDIRERINLIGRRRTKELVFSPG
jgi:hypothetical protein